MKRFLTIFAILISLLVFTNTQVKADIYHVQVQVAGNYNHCFTAGDTLVVHKPSWYGTTQWYLNSVPQGIGDSLIIIPTNITSTASYSVMAVYSSVTTGRILKLFTTPPSHAIFYVLPSGYINTTNDTIWKCGNNGTVDISVSANTYGDTYQEWNGPNNFYSTSVPTTIALSGIYTFERGNSCGVTTDTFTVVSLPTQLPSFVDTSFCNNQLTLTLDAGSGWNTYNWNTGDTTQSIMLDTLLSDTAFTVELIASNVCATDTTSVSMEQWNFPTPNIAQFNISTPFCADTVLALNPSPGFTYDTYNWTWGATGNFDTDSTLYITGDTLTGSNDYTVTIGMGFGCIATATDSFGFYQDPEAVQLCVVTVDTNGQILVAWNKDETVKAYNIYRLTGLNYQKVGTVNYPASQWYDTQVAPSASAYRYKISAVSSNGCDDEGNTGFFHGSIHIVNSPSVNGGQDLTITDKYIDESGNYQPLQYYILIDSLNNGSFSIIDSLNAVFNSYLVSSPLNGATYAMGVKLPAGGCTTAKATLAKGAKTLNYDMAISNKTNVMVGVTQAKSTAIKLHIFPNPSTGICYIQSSSKIEKLEVFNALGQLVLSKESDLQSVDLSGFVEGVYYVKVSSELGLGMARIVKK